LYLIKNTKNRIIMIAANFSEFRSELKKYLDSVEDNNETLVVKRKTGKGTVMISLDEYNSIMETMHLLSSKKNADRLYESIEQMNAGKKVQPNLDDLG
jgi:antitoxin YefM